MENRYDQMTIKQLRQKLTNNDIKLLNINGIFEIHLIVNPMDQVKLFAFSVEEDTLDDKSCANLKTACALSFYGNYPNQPMLTFWLANYNSIDAVNKSLEVAEKLEKYGIVVQRLKVEAMAKDVPELKFQEKSGQNYFEFHFKVGTKSKQEWDTLNNVCLPFGAHLFFNPYSKHPGRMIPVVTLRCYDTDFKSANDECNKLIKAIENAHFSVIDGKVQRELSVLDTNVFYDQNWLFKDDPRNFINQN